MHSGNPIMGRLAGAERYAVRDENQEGYQGFGNPAEPAAPAAALQERDRPLTVDDVVITTGIALAVIVAAAVGGFGLSTAIGDERVAAAIGLISAIGGLITVCAWSSRGSHGSPAATITFAVFEGFLVGSFSMALLGEVDGIPDSGVIITQAVVGTIGVFAGTLVVYKASTKDVDAVGCLFQFLVPFIAGLAAIVLVNAVASLISGGELVPFDGGRGWDRLRARVHLRRHGELPGGVRGHRAARARPGARQGGVGPGAGALGDAGVALHRDPPHPRDPARRLITS